MRKSFLRSATKSSRSSSLNSTPLSSLPSVLASPYWSTRAWFIVLDNVAITHLSYGVEFSKAVEQKLVAQQEAERSKFVVAKAEQERRAAIIRAEGESEAAKLISNATTAAVAAAGMGLIELRMTEASREIAVTLVKTPNVAYLPNENNMLLGLNPSMAYR
ncbi:unnamed protein product [Camellia sinensis]